MVFRSMIGAQVKRKEDPHLITGKGNYVGDLKLPGIRHVAILRSPFAHANIRHIDSSAALQHPDVLAVITGEDLVDFCQPITVAGDENAAKLRTHYPLSVGRVRHVGEAVAAVIATSPKAAEDALNAIHVDWEPLPAVTLHTALADDAPVIFDDMTDNIEHASHRTHGDVDGAFAGAYHTIKQQMVSQRLAGVSMEGRAVLAVPDAITGGLTMWNSTQAPHALRTALANSLGLPENAVRVIAPDVGGGFGVKGAVYPEDILLAVLAQRYQAPIRWIESRTEHMQATTHGRAQIADVEAAVDQDGKLLGFRLNVLADMGAYPPLNIIPELTGLMASGTYDIPAVDFRATCVYTNTTPIAAYRGAGRPEAAYYIERIMDLIATELDMDPAEVRRRNFIQPDQFPYRTPTGALYDSGEYERNLNRALEVAGYSELRAEQAQRRADDSASLLGIGIASYVEICGFGPYESAVVRVEPSGTVTVFTGTSPHGQGGETTMAQIVADEIGADFDKIIVQHGDTAAGPMGIGTFGSRGLAVGGAAVMRASEQVREKAQRIAAHMLEAAAEDVEYANGRYQVRGTPDRSLSLTQIAAQAYTPDLPDDLTCGLEATDFFRPPESVYPFGSHIAVVEIERDTGIIHLRDFFSVDDCGPRISPLLVEGQVHGGLAQGIGQALLEEVIYDERAQLLSGSLMDYALPRADNFPNFVIDKTETLTPINPLGAKGIGEAATIGSTPAVVNAVIDALQPFGIRHLDMPLNSFKIWSVMQ